MAHNERRGTTRGTTQHSQLREARKKGGGLLDLGRPHVHRKTLCRADPEINVFASNFPAATANFRMFVLMVQSLSVVFPVLPS